MSIQCFKEGAVLPFDVQCGDIRTLTTSLATGRTSTENSIVNRVDGNIGVNYGLQLGVVGSRTRPSTTNSIVDNRTTEVSISPQLLNGFKPVSFTNGGPYPIIGFDFYAAEIVNGAVFDKVRMERKRLCESSICTSVMGILHGTWEPLSQPYKYTEEYIIDEIACPYTVEAYRTLSGLFSNGDSNCQEVVKSQTYIVEVYINNRMSHLEAFKKKVQSIEGSDMRNPHWVTWKKSTATKSQRKCQNISIHPGSIFPK